MTVIIGLALGLLVGGLVVCMLSPNAKNPTLVTIFWWVGIILALIGLILLISPVILYINDQLRSMLAR